ncbi:RHS repeat-associated core domain-containing protein [Pseudomonas chlororaphis subsp. piscium]
MSFKLIGSDNMNSALLALSGSGQQNIAYAPYGSTKFNSADAPLPGFNGERTDPVSGVSHLGNGYRAYNPVLMRFNCPDSYSPFGAGGVNAYAYCAGDPINRADPSGHMSWQAGVGIGLGVLSIVAAIFTCGTSIAAAGGVMAAIRNARRIALIAGAAGVAADATGIASTATEESNPHASEVLGWASFGLGMVSLGADVANGVHQRSLKKGANESMSGSVESNEIKPMSTEGHVDAEYPEGYMHPRGYTDNFRGTGEDAILLHGTYDGRVVIGERPRRNSNGNIIGTDRDYARGITGAELARYMRDRRGINLYRENGREGPVHLLSCYAKRGAAQSLANEIDRPVIAYSKRPTITQSLVWIEDPNYAVSVYYRENDPRALCGLNSSHPASPRTFYPALGV